jgi:hypothetical protein
MVIASSSAAAAQRESFSPTIPLSPIEGGHAVDDRLGTGKLVSQGGERGRIHLLELRSILRSKPIGIKRVVRRRVHVGEREQGRHAVGAHQAGRAPQQFPARATDRPRRGVHQDQRTHSIDMTKGVAHGDGTAHRVPEQVAGLHPELVEHRLEIGDQPTKL